MHDFIKAIGAAGLNTNDLIIGDGHLHRFHILGDKPQAKNGWYILHSDGIPGGAFGNWKTGEKHTWSAKAQMAMSIQERAEFKRRMEATEQARKLEDLQRRADAQRQALTIWKQAVPADGSHAYLVSKGVQAHGLRLHEGKLVIPLRDAQGTLHSLQFIDGAGGKRFLSGGRKTGCYFSIGVPDDTLCIAEGYATAASIYEATGQAVAIAFDTGNLEPVSKALRNKFPDIKIILCADNDTQSDGNPGLTKARAAATSVGALLAVAGGI